MKKIGIYSRPFLIVFLIFIFSVYLFEDQASGETDFIKSLALIRFDEKVVAQNFALKDLNGRVVHLKDYRGKVIFLNFWATWCPHALWKCHPWKSFTTNSKEKILSYWRSICRRILKP